MSRRGLRLWGRPPDPPCPPNAEGCPAADVLRAFTFGRLPDPSDADVVFGHLERCPRCQLAVERLAADRDELTDLFRPHDRSGRAARFLDSLSRPARHRAAAISFVLACGVLCVSFLSPFAKKSARTRPNDRPFRPSVTPLEDRAVPAVTDISGSYAWDQLRIGGGGYIMDVVVHPTEANTRYATTDVGGAYRWSQATGQWEQVVTRQSMPASVTAPANVGVLAMAVDPANANTVYMLWGAGTGSNNPGSVYKSTNRGTTWTKSSMPAVHVDANAPDRGTRRLMVDPQNSNVILVGTQQHGLWRSADGGASFTQVSGSGAPATNANVNNVIFDKSSGVNGSGHTQIVYATTSNGQVFRSTNAGASWSVVSSSNSTVNTSYHQSVRIDAAGNLYVTGSGLWKYTKSSGTWSQLHTNGGIVTLDIDPANQNRIFAADGGGRVWRTTNGGASWTDLGGAQRSSPEIPWLETTVEGYFSTTQIAFDPTQANTLYVAQGIGVWRTSPNDGSNGNLLWVSQSKGIEELVAQSITSPTAGVFIAGVHDRTAFYIDDPTKYTAIQATGLQGNNAIANGTDVDFAPNNPNYVVSTSWNFQPNYSGDPGWPNFSGYSTDGGKTWTRFGSITSGNHPSVLRAGNIAVSNKSPSADYNLVWLPAGDYAPFYSVNGGQTWTQSQSFNHLRDFGRDPNFVQMGGMTGLFNEYVTSNYVTADPLIPGTFYMYLNLHGFWKSTDGGATWTQQAANNTQITQYGFHAQVFATPGRSNDLWFVSGQDGASTEGLWRTTNGGANWSKIADVTRATALAIGAPAPGMSYPTVYVSGVVGGMSGVFRSNDQGANWERIVEFPLGILVYPVAMAADPSIYGRVAVGLGGYGFAYGQLSGGAAPAAPSGLTANATSSSQINLSWTDNSNNETGFIIERSTNSSFTQNVVTASVGANVTTYSATGLSASTTYFFRVRATNSAGNSAWSNAASATTQAQSSLSVLSTGGAATASSAPVGSEGPAQAFDNNNGTKWLGNMIASGAWLAYQFGGGAANVLKQYKITSANDDFGRDPRSWVVEGSNDGTNWTSIDTRTNQTFTNRFVTNTYDVTNATAYQRYRLRVTANNGSTETVQGGIGIVQLAEWQLLGTVGSGEVAPAAPSGLTANATSASQINLSWTDNSNNETGFIIERSTNSSFTANLVSATVGANVSTYSATGLSASTTYFFRVRSTNSAGNSAWSNTASATTQSPASLGIFATSADIGGPSVAGSANESNGTYTVNASGMDIWNGSDQFHYLYRTLAGDGTITARVTSQTNTDPWAKAGVMIRAGTGAGSRHAMAVLTPGNGTRLQYRGSDGGSSSDVSAGGTFQWVRLVRSGGNVTAFRSSDGNTWTQIGSAVNLGTGSFLVGLAVTSHSWNTLGTATFTNVTVSEGSSGLTVYGDSLASGWDNWSWDSTVSLSNTSPVRSGSNSVAVTYTQFWSGFSLRSATDISTAGFTAIKFWVHGGSGSNKSLRVGIQTADTGGESSAVNITATAGQWTEITVNLSSIGNPAVIKRINISNNTGAALSSPIYFDDIRLV